MWDMVIARFFQLLQIANKKRHRHNINCPKYRIFRTQCSAFYFFLPILMTWTVKALWFEECGACDSSRTETYPDEYSAVTKGMEVLLSIYYHRDLFWEYFLDRRDHCYHYCDPVDHYHFKIEVVPEKE